MVVTNWTAGLKIDQTAHRTGDPKVENIPSEILHFVTWLHNAMLLKRMAGLLPNGRVFGSY